MLGVKDKDRQIAWVEGKLRELEADSDQLLGGMDGDRFQETISPKKESAEFFRGNSQRLGQSISPKKKGRGKNKLPASGSLVPVVQVRRDKQGRVVEYPKVEGERVSRELAFEYPHQFYWQYCYSVQDSGGGWHTKKVSVPAGLVWSVRSAIAAEQPVSKVLSVIG
jgi:hypothetical protein